MASLMTTSNMTFGEVYGTYRPDLIKLELQALSREDAEEYLDKADLAYQDARAVRILIHGKEMHRSDATYEELNVAQFDKICSSDKIKLTFVKRQRCLHCSNVASVSCLVEDSEIVLQLVCSDHIRGKVIWMKIGVSK